MSNEVKPLNLRVKYADGKWWLNDSPASYEAAVEALRLVGDSAALMEMMATANLRRVQAGLLSGVAMIGFFASAGIVPALIVGVWRWAVGQ